MKTACILTVTLLGAFSGLQAVESASSTSFEPPKKYGPERYMAGWERNPFSIPTPPAPPAAVESEFKDLAIKSIYGPKDSPIFSLVNTKTHERMRITMEKPTKDGVELKSFSLAENRRETTIEVSKGTETATLKYATDYVSPAATGAPGARPGGMPGMPGGPGMPGTANRIPIPQLGAANPAANRGLPGQPPSNNVRNAPGSPVVVGAPGANAATADATARRRMIPGVAGTANTAAGIPAVNVGVGNNGSPTITLGTTGSNTPAPQPQNTGAPGEISPPIVRPPPSIYLDGSQQQ